MVRVEKTPILSSSSCQSTATGESSFADLELSGSSFSLDGGAILVGVLKLSSHRHDLVNAVAGTCMFDCCSEWCSEEQTDKEAVYWVFGFEKVCCTLVVFLRMRSAIAKKMGGIDCR